MAQEDYIAGTCNIGQEETTLRRNFGWATLAMSIILLSVLIWSEVNPWWRLFVFFPATMAASGFLQAYFHFCSGFARKGIFNFGSLGIVHQVDDEASKAQDKKRGNQITLYAVLIGTFIAIVAKFI